jgi:hypothetical protein
MCSSLQPYTVYNDLDGLLYNGLNGLISALYENLDGYSVCLYWQIQTLGSLKEPLFICNEHYLLTTNLNIISVSPRENFHRHLSILLTGNLNIVYWESKYCLLGI